MGWLYLVLGQFVHLGEGMIIKHYGKKYGDGGFLTNALISFFSMIFFIVSDKDGFYFPKEIWVFGMISCLLYATGFYAMYVALNSGSFAITRLVTSLSTIFPIFYGLMFLGEKATSYTYTGMVLIFVSMFLVNYKKSDTQNQKPVYVKWIIAMILTVVSNGFISIVMRIQQLHFEDKCSNEFMIISLGGSFIALLIAGILKDNKGLIHTLKHGGFLGACAGAANGISNHLTLLIYLYIPISIATPMRTGLGLILTFVVSILIYKEKFTKQQLVGAIIGIAALILLKF